MQINVTTVYTKERMLRYNHFIAASKKILWIIMAVCTLVVIGCFSFMASMNALDGTMVVCLVMIIALDLLYIFCYLILPRLTINKSKNLNTAIEYSFDEDCFRVEASNEYISETSTVKYAMLSKMAKNGTELYLFVARNRGYIVDLSELSEEQITSLTDTLKKGISSK